MAVPIRSALAHIVSNPDLIDDFLENWEAMKMKLLTVVFLVGFAVARYASAASVAELRCESRANPLGIDVCQPQLSWIISSDRRGEVQTAYQVLVASSPELLAADQGNLWDSGRVESNATVQVVYSGRHLVSSAQCFWKVRIWDRDSRPSAWSEPASWSMGLLSLGDWSARWISDPVLADPANRPMRPVNCYRSELATQADATKWIVLDLGADKRMDAVDLIPARPQHQNSDFRTAMFPLRFKIDVASDRSFSSAKRVVDDTAGDVPNPRQNACRFQFAPVTARFIRLTVTTLPRWDGQEYGIALGGFAVFDGTQSIATGASVECSDSIETEFNSKRFLTESKPNVKLVDSPALEPGTTDVAKKYTTSRVPMLRREFSLAENVRRATLSVSARGFYEMRMNGERVSDDLLAPGFMDYDARLQYQTYDVTKHLKKGPNAICALLGYGWYCGHMNLFQMRCIYGYFPQLLAQLDVEMTDGTHVIVGTDGQWRSTLDGPVRWSDLLDGEGYDCNRQMPGWDLPGFDDRRWQPVWSQPRNQTPLVWDRCQPVQVIREFQPVAVKQVKAGVYVFDFGQEFTGWCRLKADGPAGTHVCLRHAEMVQPDGNLDVVSLMGTQQREDYILDGKGERTLEPHFTYHGFRYVELSGLTGPLKPDTLIGIHARTAAGLNGQFECSNELYNRIQKAADWTQANLLYDVPNGCAARSERIAWMGDIRPCVQSLLFNYDSIPLLTKYVQDIRDDQLPDGRFTDIAPHAHLTGTTVAVGTPGWADAGVSLPWDLYVNTGDKRMLAEHFEAARRWVDWIHTNNPDLLWRNKHGEDWGDWLSAGSPVTPRDLGSTAFFAHSTDLVSRMAQALGKRREAATYQQLFQNIRKAFVKNYVSEEGIIAGGGDRGPVDVTALVRSMIKDRKLAFKATNDVLGLDPAPNRVKHLRLKFRIGNQSDQKDFPENARVEIDGSKDDPVEVISATYGANPDDLGDAQGSYALALQFGLLDEPLRSLAARRLDQLVVRSKYHPTTGFWSSSELLLALSGNGFHSDAAEMLNQPDEPSWGHMAEFNTTFWESFDAERLRISLNHWPFSAVSQWLFSEVAGIEPDEHEPGYLAFRVCPRPTKEMTWCKASYDSVRGHIVSNWSMDGDTFTLAVTVPANCTATVYLPTSDIASVTEGSQPVAHVAGVRLLDDDNGRIALQVDAGTYKFVLLAR
jgi:alpha-L-rhamnosidase